MSDRLGLARKRLTIGRSTAGVPRTYRTLRNKHRSLHRLLHRAASECGELLKSVSMRLGLQ
jgi:hypothetical protein